MKGYHDLGGDPAGPIDRGEHDPLLWEKRVEAILLLLMRRGLMRIDENRRGLETMGDTLYHGAGYSQRRIMSIANNLLLKGVLSVEELSAKLRQIDSRTGQLP